MSHYIIKCEFPDEDQMAYVTQETIMGKGLKKFHSYEAAEKYACENFAKCVYNIIETNE